jgi:hypothetical protein
MRAHVHRAVGKSIRVACVAALVFTERQAVPGALACRYGQDRPVTPGVKGIGVPKGARGRGRPGGMIGATRGTAQATIDYPGCRVRLPVRNACLFTLRSRSTFEDVIYHRHDVGDRHGVIAIEIGYPGGGLRCARLSRGENRHTRDVWSPTSSCLTLHKCN